MNQENTLVRPSDDSSNEIITATLVMIKFVGRSLEGRPLTPPKSVVDGNRKIELPSVEEQRKGFSLSSVEETVLVTRLFPSLYKVYLPKGQKRK